MVKDWVKQKKLTQKIEDLTPGAWFKEEHAKWTKQYQEWRRRQTDFKDPNKKKALIAKKKDELKKKADEAKKAAEEAGEEAEEISQEIDMEIKADDLDVWAVEDVADIGNCEPLFQNFAFEDWTLLTLRYELHLLVHAFNKDVNDPDRPSFSEEHMQFYYNKYFKKTFNLKNLNLAGLSDFVELIKESLSFSDSKLLSAPLTADTAFVHFVKLAEEHRRERERRVDAGDETAELKFVRPAPPPKQNNNQQSGGNSNNGNNYQSGSYAAQKRPYSGHGGGNSNYPPAKRQYSSNNGGGGGGGGGGGAWGGNRGYGGGYGRR